MGRLRNITVTVSEETYREARAWCALRDTCLSHVVQAFISELPRMEELGKWKLPETLDFNPYGHLLERLGYFK